MPQFRTRKRDKQVFPVKQTKAKQYQNKDINDVCNTLNKHCLPFYIIAEPTKENSNAKIWRENNKLKGYKIYLNQEDGIYKDTILHELGHAYMFDYTFGDRLEKVDSKPSFEEAEKYSVLTYRCSINNPEASEGWAESFRDYHTRPKFLKKNSPKLYRFWKDVANKNYSMRRTVKKINQHIDE